MNRLYRRIPAFLLALMVGLMATSTAFGTATIVIENADPAGTGFNDSTPASPVGGNNGTTVGQQRLNAFQFAANIWGATLTSGPTITIRASWTSLSCSANSGVLGSAGNSGSIWANFSGSVPNTWYGNALRNALTNSDASCSTPEIVAQFNSNIGNAGCLQSLHWYYGLDGNEGGSGIDLVAVLLHEFGHGLGFQSFTSSSSGAQAGSAPNGPYPSIYDRFLLDNSTGKTWAQMTNAERAASAINTNNLVWNGPQATSDATTVLTAGKDPAGHAQMYAPNPVQAGSSVSHWNTTATPNQLMEPSINNNLTHSVVPPQDLTFSLLRDLGWCSGCPNPTPSACPPPPPNDDFVNSQIISGCSGSVNGTNAGANKEVGEPSHSPDNNAGGGSVWYQWQAPGSGSVTMTTAGSNFDTLLGIYTGNSVGALTAIAKNDDVGTPGDLTSSVTFTASAGTVYRIAVDGWGGSVGNITLNWTSSSCPSLLINSVAPPAGRTSGGQQIVLTGAFNGLSTVTIGGAGVSWFYTNGPGDTSQITVTTPAHSVGAVQIDLTPTTGSVYSKANVFAYLPTVFTDDTLSIGITTAKALHIIELRQAVDAMRAVAGLGPAPWTDPTLVAGNFIRAIHIQELRTYLNGAASSLGYSTSAYTDPSLSAGFLIKGVHIEELRQRIRTIAG